MMLHPIIRQLRTERVKAGLTQAKLAEVMGYDQTTIHYWEVGKSRPSWCSFLNWTQSLGLELELRRNGDRRRHCRKLRRLSVARWPGL